MDSREGCGAEDRAGPKSDPAGRMEVTFGMLGLKGRREGKAEAGMKGIYTEGCMWESEREEFGSVYLESLIRMPAMEP